MTQPASKPPQASDPARFAANRRVAVFVAIFAMLFTGAVALVLREEKRRSLLIQPSPPAAPTEIPLPAAKTPAETPGPGETARPPAPTSPALQQSEEMATALAAFREAAEFMKSQRYELAEERAAAALLAYPQMASAQRMLGLIYIQQGRIRPAIAILEASLRNEPFNPEALTNLAFAYLQNNNPQLALELVETCRSLHPTYTPALIQHGLILLTMRDFTQAITVLEETVEAFPAVPGPRNNLAIALYRSGDHAGAQEQLTKVLEMDPKNFSALFNTGAIYAQETNAPAAIPWLRQAMQQMPLHQFRTYLNDTDLTPIRETPEFLEFLEELDPAFPGAPPPP